MRSGNPRRWVLLCGFYSNDRGRGDSVLSEVRVDSGGNIVALKTEASIITRIRTRKVLL